MLSDKDCQGLVSSSGWRQLPCAAQHQGRVQRASEGGPPAAKSSSRTSTTVPPAASCMPCSVVHAFSRRCSWRRTLSPTGPSFQPPRADCENLRRGPGGRRGWLRGGVLLHARRHGAAATATAGVVGWHKAGEAGAAAAPAGACLGACVATFWRSTSGIFTFMRLAASANCLARSSPPEACTRQRWGCLARPAPRDPRACRDASRPQAALGRARAQAISAERCSGAVCRLPECRKRLQQPQARRF